MRPAIFLLFSLSLSLENLRASTKETEEKPSSRKIINQVSTKQDESHWSRFQLSSCSCSLNSNTHFGWMIKMAIKKQMIFPTNLSNRWILSSKKKKRRPATYVRPNYYSIDRVTFEATIIFPLNYFDYKFWSTTNKRIICISWKISEDAIAELKTKVEDL